MLRMRYVDTARNYAVSRNIQDFYQFELYQEASMIVSCLRSKNMDPALAWCDKNSDCSYYLEFYLVCQQFIEHVRNEDNKMMAISFAWKFTEPFWRYKKELLQVLATVLFGCNTRVPRYKKLFDEERWEFLVKLFEMHFNWRHKFANETSSLGILLESGITALKVPFCYDNDDCKKDDPLQQEYFRTFTSSLPYAKCKPSSTLRCSVTKKRLTEENPPFMLPNGYAYSKEAILQTQKREEVTCPRTGSVFRVDDLRQLKLDQCAWPCIYGYR